MYHLTPVLGDGASRSVGSRSTSVQMRLFVSRIQISFKASETPLPPKRISVSFEVEKEHALLAGGELETLSEGTTSSQVF